MVLLLFCLLSPQLIYANLPPGLVWERVDNKRGNQANALIGSSGALIVVGNEGAIWRTADREHWSVEKSGTTDALFGVAEGNGVLVAVGAGGRILRSSVSGAWTVEFSGMTVNFESVTHGGGIFVAVGTGGKVVFSSDGRKWKPWATGTTKNLHDVIWDGSSFIVAGDAGTALSAPPGGTFSTLVNAPGTITNFDRVAKGTNGSFVGPGYFVSNSSVWTWLGDLNFNDVAAGAGVFVGVSDAGVISASGNGTQWTPVLTTSVESFRSVTWTGTEFAAVTDSGRVAISSNGYRWKMLGFFRQYQSGCWDGLQYILVGGGGMITTSIDGKWWTAERNPKASDLLSVASGGGLRVAVGEDSCILSSLDGHIWQNRSLPCSWSLTDVHWSGSAFWAVGADGIILTSANAQDWTIATPGMMGAAVWDGSRYVAFSGKNVIQSLDGNQWTPLSTTSAAFPINDLIWTGSYYIAVGNSTTLLRSADGVTWTQATFNGTTSISSYLSVAFSGSALVAVANNSYHARSTDGVTWTRYASGFSGLNDILWDGNRFLAAGSWGVYQSSDGIAWQRIYSTDSNHLLNSITWNGSRYLAAGSTLSSGGGLVLSSSDAATWSPVTTGAGGSYIDVECEPGGDAIAISSTGAIQRYRNNTWLAENSGIVENARGIVPGASGFLACSVNSMASLSQQDGVWNLGNLRVNSDLLRSVTSGNGRLVVATSTSMVTSVDGVNWASEALAADVGISSRTQGIWTGDQFAFVIGNSVWTSATGLGWTKLATVRGCQGLYDIQSFNGNLVLAGWASSSTASGIWNLVNGVVQPAAAWFNNFSSLVSAGSLILAFGPNPSSISTDGTTWTRGEYDPTLSRSVNDVIHTPMGFFAIDGELLKSTDGRNWSKADTNLVSIPSSAMVYADGRIVTVGSNGLAASTDGITWSYLFKSDFYRDVAWGNGRYVAVSSTKTASSTDGVSWQFASQVFALESVVWTGTEFLATNASGAVLTSDDGLVWQYRVIPGAITGYTYENGIHVVATSVGEIFKSSDSVSWTRVFKSGSGLVRVTFTGNRFFLFGSQTYKSSDAVTWTTLTRTYQDMDWTGSQYVGVGASGVIGLSPDATTWTQKATTTTQALRAAVWTGDRIVAVGNAGAAVSSTDGNIWTSLNFSTTANLIDVAWTGTNLLTVAADGSIAHLLPSPAAPVGFSATALFSDGMVTLIADATGRVAKLEVDGWRESVRKTGSTLHVIAATSSGYRACGNSGHLLQSNDGTAWISESGWNHVIGGATVSEVFQVKSVIDGTLIGLGSLGSVLDSPDGRLWQIRSPAVVGARLTLNSCVQAGSDVITVGNSGKILRFGTTGAKEILSRTKQNLLAIASAGDRLVAVGAGGVILYSGSGADVPDSYERWIDGQGVPVSSIEVADDPNQDGVANVTAYLFGIPAVSPPSGQDRERLPQCEISSEGAGISFEINPDRADLELVFERTFDFWNWSELARKSGGGSWGGPAAVIEEAGAGGRVRYRLIDTSASGAPTAFYRIRQNLR
ncbi:MAG: hypothetical protein ACRCXD_05435 [Luteolibacter sp.]